MLKILKNFVIYKNYNYLMMDGTTSVQSRQPLIKKFNEASIDSFEPQLLINKKYLTFLILNYSENI